MIGAVDQGHVGALVLLDLSAAFDTVDHQILIEVLQRRFGVSGRPSVGWLTTLVVDVRSSEQVAVIQKTLLSTSLFHKDQSLVQRHFLNTLKTSHISWKACIITCSLMTCRAKSTEGQLMSQQSSQL